MRWKSDGFFNRAIYFPPKVSHSLCICFPHFNWQIWLRKPWIVCNSLSLESVNFVSITTDTSCQTSNQQIIRRYSNLINFKCMRIFLRFVLILWLYANFYKFFLSLYLVSHSRLRVQATPSYLDKITNAWMIHSHDDFLLPFFPEYNALNSNEKYLLWCSLFSLKTVRDRQCK